jgi:hypothetical protein
LLNQSKGHFEQFAVSASHIAQGLIGLPQLGQACTLNIAFNFTSCPQLGHNSYTIFAIVVMFYVNTYSFSILLMLLFMYVLDKMPTDDEHHRPQDF